MKTTQLFLCISLLLCSFSQAAGQTLTGQLLDENNTPVEFANVILLSLPDSTFIQGTVTDVSGNFRFEKPDKRSKLLRISYVGYEDILSPLRNENMGTFTLKPLATMLGEAVVIGRRPTYSLKRGALTTNVENTLLSGVGTANDVLKRMPGLQVTDGGVTVFGKGVPLIYINGRKVRDVSELEQLDSKNIAKVELITNPGAEYDAEVKAVLKIKTLKPVGEGLGGSIRTALQKGEQWSNNQQVSLNYRKQKLDVFGSFYYDKTNRVTEQRDVQTVYADQLLEICGNSRTPFSSDYIQGDGGLNYQFNDKHTSGLRYTINHSSSKGSIPNNYEVSLNGAEYDHINFMNKMNGNGDTHKVNTYYTGAYGKLGVDLNIDWLHSESENNQNITEGSKVEGDQTIHSQNAVRNNLYAGKLVFSHPVGSGTLQWGTEISYTNRHNNYTNEEQVLDDAASKATSSNQAGFVSYYLPIGKTNLSAGLRYEHVSFAYYEAGVKQDKQSKDYNNLFPDVSFSFPLKKVQYSVGYSVRTQRPSYSALRSDVQYANRYTYERGNPFLQPSTEHNISLQAMYKFFQISASYSYAKEAIISVATPYKDDPMITVFGIENIPNWQTAGVVMSFAPKIGIWEPIWTFQFLQPIVKGEHRGSNRSFNRAAYAASLTNQFRLPWEMILSTDLSCNSKYNSGYSMKKAAVGVDLGLRKIFLNNALEVSLQATDIFASMKDNFITYGQIVTFDKWNYADSRQVKLRISYYFNSARSKYKGTGAANDEQRRL